MRYLNPADRNLARITKGDKNFAKRLDSKNREFPIKLRDIHNIEKRNSIGIRVFGYGNKEKHPICVSKKCCEDKHVDLSLIGEREKNHYVLIKDFNTFKYDHTVHGGRKHFRCNCLHAFFTEEVLKRHIKDCLKPNGKQAIKMPKR